MNFRCILTAVFGLGLLLVSCKNQQKDININQVSESKETGLSTNYLIGSWVDQSKTALDFSLYEDGTAKSDNMATLLYQQWYEKDNQLLIIAESIGNKQSFIDTIAYSIERINSNELVLKRGDLILNYERVDETNKTIQNGEKQILKGRLVFGHESRVFMPCESDKTFWISDKTGELKDLYTELTKDEKPYTPIFAEIEVVDKGKAKEGFPLDYESVYEITKILNTRNTTDKDCE